jgi:nucleotide-binding universal stress UspA family protein
MWQCPPRRILAATDLGDASDHAIALAGTIASAFESSLTVIHAESVEVPAYFTRDQMDTMAAQVRAARAQGRRLVAEHAAQQTRHPVEVVLVERPPAEAILEAAGDQDLIVMGTHGRRGPSRWWLGSVAERVVGSAAVPVLVTRASPLPLTRRLLVVQPDVAGRLVACGEALAGGLGLEIEVRPSADQCTPDAFGSARMVMVATRPMAGPGGHPGIPALIRGCPSPVLFVPLNH